MRPYLGCLILALTLPIAGDPAAASESMPSVWFSPDGETPDLIELFNSPDQWAQARAKLNVFKFGPRQVGTPGPAEINTYPELVKADAFRKLNTWKIAIAIEAPAVKEWDCTGRRAAEITLEYIQNLRAAGGAATFIAMDEPLVSGFRACHLTFDEAAERTAAYVKAVSSGTDISEKKLAIGDIEPYPSYSVDQLKQWIKVLGSAGFKPAFFHLDVDINDVDLHPKINMADDLRALKAFLQQEGIPFGIIFWSGHDPESSDKAYYDHVIDYTRRIRHVLGRPEHAIFQSWVLRASRNCSSVAPCGRESLRCGGNDPKYCGMYSVPLNLPENRMTFSHTQLVNSSLAILNGP